MTPTLAMQLTKELQQQGIPEGHVHLIDGMVSFDCPAASLDAMTLMLTCGDHGVDDLMRLADNSGDADRERVLLYRPDTYRHLLDQLRAQRTPERMPA